jgi:hypothetical protein
MDNTGEGRGRSTGKDSVQLSGEKAAFSWERIFGSPDVRNRIDESTHPPILGRDRENVGKKIQKTVDSGRGSFL